MKALFFILSANLLFGMSGLAEEKPPLKPVKPTATPLREVDDEHEADRLLGWDVDQSEKRRLEKERKNGTVEVLKFDKEWNRDQAEGLKEYKAAEQKRHREMDEGGIEYQKDMKRKRQEDLDWEREREKMLAERNRNRRNYGAKIHLSEEEELGLIAKGERVEWDKRNFFGKKGGTGRPGGSEYIIPPPPPPPTSPDMAPTPQFMDTEIPPPPPPPANFEFPQPPPQQVPFDEPIPPPPPPPLFDDEF